MKLDRQSPIRPGSYGDEMPFDVGYVDNTTPQPGASSGTGLSLGGGHFYNSPAINIVPGTETIGSNGVVNAQVKLLGSDGNFYLKTNNGGFSTLTPADWSLAQAKGEMSQAFLNRTQIGNRWFGESNRVNFQFNAPNNTSVLQWRGYPVKP